MAPVGFEPKPCESRTLNHLTTVPVNDLYEKYFGVCRNVFKAKRQKFKGVLNLNQFLESNY